MVGGCHSFTATALPWPQGWWQKDPPEMVSVPVITCCLQLLTGRRILVIGE
jgi:hypothetical protein